MSDLQRRWPGQPGAITWRNRVEKGARDWMRDQSRDRAFRATVMDVTGSAVSTRRRPLPVAVFLPHD